MDVEMSQEIRVHLEMLEQRYRASGMNDDEARYAALRRFGGVEQIKERCREQRGWTWLENSLRDLRCAARSLRRAPLFSGAVIATLALCIGPNTAILTVLYALVLKPAPFHEPERLVQVYNAFEKLGGGRSRQAGSVPQYRDFQAHADLFEGFALMRYAGTTLDDDTAAISTNWRVGAGLLGRSFARVLATDPGFDTSNLVQGRMAVPKAFEPVEANVGLQRRIVEGLREIPGVEGAALVFDYALAGSFRSSPFVIRGEAASPGANRPLVAIDPVSPEFFETLRITLLEGRGFTCADDIRSSPVLVVDDLFAQRYFPGRSAVGQEVALSDRPPPDGQPWPRIVGVVRRPQLSGLEARDGVPIVFMPMVQQPAFGFSFVVRSPRETGDLLREIRRKLHTIEPTLPLYGTATIEEGLDSLMMGRRGVTLLIGAFAGLALVLAGIGLYGVLAYDVSQRTREIGIRGAIGATRTQIVAMILRQGMWRTGLGVAIGFVAAIYLTRFLQAWLFDVGRFDPVAFSGVSLLMLAVSLLACWLPARRAARVDPMVALRCE